MFRSLSQLITKSAAFLVTIFVASTSVQADDIIYLDNVSSASLVLPQQSARVLVNYPGPDLSGICAIEIVADSFGRKTPIKDFISTIDIEYAFGGEGDPRRVEIISRTVARIELIPSTYVDGIKITTCLDETLEEAINRSLGEDRRVVVMPRSCGQQ